MPLQAALHGALLLRLDESLVNSRGLVGEGLTIVPYGSVLRDTRDEVHPLHMFVPNVDRRGDHLGNDLPLVAPAAAPLGMVTFGPQQIRLEETGVRPVMMLGSSGIDGDPGNPEQAMLGIVNYVPIHERAYTVVGSGKVTAQLADYIEDRAQAAGRRVRLGWQVLDDEHLESEIKSAAAVCAYQAQEALKAMLLLESRNVMLEPVAVSRQVRRAAERSEGRVKIALTVKIKAPVRSRDRGAHAQARNFSHSFEVRGHYRHVTRGSHAANPDKLAPCPVWQVRHPHSEICRREFVPPHVVDAGPDKPLVIKARGV